MKRAVAWVLVLLILLTMSACGDKMASDTQSEQQNMGDNLSCFRTYLSADPISMDVSRISDIYSSEIVENVMESLVRMSEVNGTSRIVAGDALTWESNMDGTVWTFYLGDNTWSDGRPVTAQDYVYSLRRSADPSTDCPNGYFLKPVAGYDQVRDGAPLDTLGVRALDEKTLQITLSYPVPSFLEMTCGTVYYPQRKDIVEAYGEQYGTEPEYMVFNGPYVVESWEHDTAISLKKREEYWNADDVRIPHVQIFILKDSDEACTMFENGELDYLTTSDAKWLDKLSAQQNIQSIKVHSASVNYVFFNTEDALFQNINIRKAFTLALNRREMNETLYGGSSTPASGWVSAAMTVGSVNYRDFAGDLIQTMYQRAEAESMTARDYLLLGMEELGLGNDPGQLKILFSLAGSDQRFQGIGEYIRNAYINVLGVETEISYGDWAQFSANLETGNYQIGYMSWEAYYNDPVDVLSLFQSNIDTLRTGWSNSEYDALVLEAQSEMDEEKRLELYRKAEEILLLEECAVCPVLFPSVNCLYQSYCNGYPTLAFTSGIYQDMFLE